MIILDEHFYWVKHPTTENWVVAEAICVVGFEPEFFLPAREWSQAVLEIGPEVIKPEHLG